MSWPKCGVRSKTGTLKATIVEYYPSEIKGDTVLLEIRNGYPSPLERPQGAASLTFLASITDLSWMNREAATKFRIPGIPIHTIERLYKDLEEYEESQRNENSQHQEQIK